MSTLVYLYAITGPDGSSVRTTDAIEGRNVRTLEESGLVALVSDVPERGFDQDALDENVRDPAWLTPRATAHQAVNAAAHEQTEASLPVPFGTIFLEDERVREMLRTRADELKARLASVRRRSEWVVGLYRDTVQAAEHLSRVSEAVAGRQPVAASAGRRYLETRKDEAARREQLRRLEEEATTASHAAVARVSKRAFEEPIVQDAGDLVARTTYLVRGDDEGRFRTAVERFNDDWRDRGFELRATGPWPVYRSSGMSR
ncbi:MAG: GvpL/GvpF family gas vesicle protein [Chloroflexota bacterium]|nr:GvpL/GvpF family gas vesicle protein [Chloroflexota bacterium]MDE3192668.1 GvpL/GvpF family gas vesicle protein [Chloroflexota bacterium]